MSLETIQEIAREYGYWAVFMGIALENTGIPIPGETIILVSGFLAGSGELNYWWVLASAIAGAVIGDNFGYWLGRLGGWERFVRIGNFFRVPEKYLEEAKRQFSKNAPRAVFFGRFVALLRIFAGPIAGIVEMPYFQFLLCNFGGAALWASIVVSLPFFLGRIISLQEVIRLVAKLGIVAFILIAIWIGLTVWWESRKKFEEEAK
ncbi:DedA family protein [Lusitaniella coriacea LEGE 07167]|nr:DedA family protein [Lusitaniella coriacea]